MKTLKVGITGIILAGILHIFPLSGPVWYIKTVLLLISVICLIVATVLLTRSFFKNHKIRRQAKICLYCMTFFLLAQLFIFRDYLSPFLWGKLRVENVWWTGADASVDAGRMYLRYITPDSLKSKDMYYPEVYLEDQPNSNFSQSICFDSYIIKGKVIGQKMGAGRPSPVLLIESFQVLPEITVWGLKATFIIELIIFGITAILILRRQPERE